MLACGAILIPRMFDKLGYLICIQRLQLQIGGNRALFEQPLSLGVIGILAVYIVSAVRKQVATSLPNF